ncbi:LuxR C-terminal-related transcriptional regulator, partial [Streptosporangium sp. NPDC003464]
MAHLLTPGPVALARHMIRMRLALMRNSLRGDNASNLYTGVSLGLILAFATIAVAVLRPVYLPVTLAVWLSGWIFGPIFIGGGSEALRPEYFSMLPATPGRIAAALLAGAFAGPAPAVNLVALMSLPVYGWRFGPAGVLIGLAAAVITLITMVMISHVIVALIGLFVRSRATAAVVGVVTGTAIALCSNGWAPVAALGGADTALRHSPPHIKTLVLTTFDADSDVLPAIEAGATGYLLKDAPTDELLRAVRAAAAGEPVLSPSVAGRLMGQVRKPVKAALTDRELQVLALVADGASNRQAAAKLFISEASINSVSYMVGESLNSPWTAGDGTGSSRRGCGRSR